jgi:hypothetical protein
MGNTARAEFQVESEHGREWESEERVTSGSDPHSTHNADKDRGPSGPRRHGLKLVRRSETQMSKQTPERTSEWSRMARVRIVMWTRMEVRTGSEGMGSDL